MTGFPGDQPLGLSNVLSSLVKMAASVSIGEASKIVVVAQNKTHGTVFGALALSIRGSVSASQPQLHTRAPWGKGTIL